MKQKIEEKLKAKELRKKGYSLDEIIKKVKVAKSSVSVWVREVQLSEKAKKRLLTRIKLGQLVSGENKKQRTRAVLQKYLDRAHADIKKHNLSPYFKKVICALIYFCEGIKDHFGGIKFSNSDPALVRLFLNLFRASFQLDETKFRVCVHLHEYHNVKKQLKFWSQVTQIPRGQFMNPYLKPHTGMRKRENYPGCATINYYSADVARQLLGVARAFIKIHGSIG